MKRRGFLGLIGGAAVAGPSMAKQAVAATLADGHLVGIATAANDFVGGGYPDGIMDW